MNIDKIRMQKNKIEKNANVIGVHYALVAWMDVLGNTSIRSAYFDEMVEAEMWIDGLTKLYNSYEHVYCINSKFWR